MSSDFLVELHAIQINASNFGNNPRHISNIHIGNRPDSDFPEGVDLYIYT